MNTNNSSDADDLVARVVDSFQRMSIPPAPSVRETVTFIERALANDSSGVPAKRKPTGVIGFFGLPHLTPRQQIAAGGVTASTIAALVLLFVALNGGQRLSAMERMARQLREVTSYSYRTSSETSTADNDAKGLTTWRESGKSYWRTPDLFHGAEKIVKIETTGGKISEEVLKDFVEIFPPDGMGVFINHKKKTYFRSRFEPTGSRTYPLEPLKLIREDHPQPKRELGTRQIGGKPSRGYVVTLKTGYPPREHDWEVWVDPETDLPVEIGYQVDDQKRPRTTTVLRIDNFRWNEAIDSKLFEPTVPEGYREISATPEDEKAPADAPP